MKTQRYSSIVKITASVLLFILGSSFIVARGEIKNGYEKDIVSLRLSYENLSAMLQIKSLANEKKRKLKSAITVVLNHISFYELTGNLLEEFNAMAPILYEEINTITDQKGRPVNVYVKFVPADETEVKAWGTTYLANDLADRHACWSEYGANSVSVKIWLVSKALLVLSHEFGHVKYQVPNLSSYIDYYKKNYNGDHQEVFIGHKPDDLSGKSAADYERRFRKECSQFLKSSNQKMTDPVALRVKIRRHINSAI